MPSIFGKRIDVPGGRRRAERELAVLAASLSTLEGSYSVLVEDVSATGARLRGYRLPPAAADVMIRVGALEILASIAWSTNDQCGIKFAPAFSSKDLELLRQEGRWATVMGIVEVQNLGDSLSDDRR